MLRRLAIWLRLGRYLPRCGAEPPWRLTAMDDAGPCIVPRGHEKSKQEGADWHASAAGFIWNDTLGQWRWQGPIIDLADEYRALPDRMPSWDEG